MKRVFCEIFRFLSVACCRVLEVTAEENPNPGMRWTNPPPLCKMIIAEVSSPKKLSKYFFLFRPHTQACWATRTFSTCPTWRATTFSRRSHGSSRYTLIPAKIILRTRKLFKFSKLWTLGRSPSPCRRHLWTRRRPSTTPNCYRNSQVLKIPIS